MKKQLLYWWQPKKHSKWNLKAWLSGEMKRYKNVPSNFGDELSAFLVKKVLNTEVIKAESNDTDKLLGIGSIMHHARNNDVIWGSGINGKFEERKIDAKKLNILSVRGPLTRKILMDYKFSVPEVFGDPGLLVSKYYKPKETKKKDFVLVPHFSEIEIAKKLVQPENLVSPTDPLLEVIDQIFNSKFVISSSLHGLIVAESYGIPARLLKLSDNEPIFKYKDYYLGTGRKQFKPAKSIVNALEMGGENNAIFDENKLISILQDYYA